VINEQNASCRLGDERRAESSSSSACSLVTSSPIGSSTSGSQMSPSAISDRFYVALHATTVVRLAGT
jgi:hypothetical protein